LAALFDGEPRVSRLRFWAEREAATVLFPDAPVAVANQPIGATDDARVALLPTPNV
jgi:hypothetical protein